MLVGGEGRSDAREKQHEKRPCSPGSPCADLVQRRKQEGAAKEEGGALSEGGASERALPGSSPVIRPDTRAGSGRGGVGGRARGDVRGSAARARAAAAAVCPGRAWRSVAQSCWARRGCERVLCESSVVFRYPQPPARSSRAPSRAFRLQPVEALEMNFAISSEMTQVTRCTRAPREEKGGRGGEDGSLPGVPLSRGKRVPRVSLLAQLTVRVG